MNKIWVGSTTGTVITTVLRYLLTALGAWLVAEGWFTDEQANNIVGALLVIIPTVVGAIIARRNNNEKKVMADRLPDSVAEVKQ